MKSQIIIIIFISGFFPQVWGAQLDAEIMTDDETISPNFSFLRIIYIDYPEGGKIAELLRGEKQNISFNFNSESTDAKNLIKMINENLESIPSTVHATDVKVKYRAILSGNQNSAVVELKLELIPTLTNPIIKENGDLRTIDANWRGISITNPVILETNYGLFDINNPKSALDIMIPDVMELLDRSDIEVLELPIINSSEIQKFPLSKWHSLFDNTAIIASSAQYNFTGKHVITHYSMGECNLESGFCQDRKWSKDLDLDQKYRIVIIESRDDASIAIEGYAANSFLGTIETFETRLSNPVKESPATDEFPATVMYGMASVALIGGIAMFVFSSKKVKKEQNQGQTGIDPTHLRAYETSESSGGYKTNRGETYLIGNQNSKTAV